MRCPAHPERIAATQCSVCAVHHCEACAPAHPFVGGAVCPGCAPSVARRAISRGLSGGSERRREVAQHQHRAALRIFLGAVVLVGLAAAPWGTLLPEEDEGRQLQDAYAALEAVGLALEAFREREGSYPADLAQLQPELLSKVPADPFATNGQALRYAPVQGADDPGRVLYSVGPDGLDQGGAPLDRLSGAGDLRYLVW